MLLLLVATSSFRVNETPPSPQVPTLLATLARPKGNPDETLLVILRKLSQDRLRDSALDALIKRPVVMRDEVNLANSAILPFTEATSKEPQDGPVEVELARGREAY